MYKSNFMPGFVADPSRSSASIASASPWASSSWCWRGARSLAPPGTGSPPRLGAIRREDGRSASRAGRIARDAVSVTLNARAAHEAGIAPAHLRSQMGTPGPKRVVREPPVRIGDGRPAAADIGAAPTTFDFTTSPTYNRPTLAARRRIAWPASLGIGGTASFRRRRKGGTWSVFCYQIVRTAGLLNPTTGRTEREAAAGG